MLQMHPHGQYTQFNFDSNWNSIYRTGLSLKDPQKWPNNGHIEHKMADFLCVCVFFF